MRLNPLTYIACIGILVTISKSTFQAYGQEYYVEGKLEVIVKSKGGKEAQTENHKFLVGARGDSYKIKIWRESNPTNYHEYAFIDGNLFTFHHLRAKEVISVDTVRSTTDKDVVRYPAIVEKRNTVPTDGTRAQFVWFAYASSAYFKNLKNNLVLPIWSPEDPSIRRQPFDMFASYELFSKAPQLPIGVKFINDGFYRSYNPMTKNLDVIPLISPYNKGFTNAYYQVLEVTNYNSLKIPTSFIFVAYLAPLSSNDKPYERIAARGIVTKLDGSMEKNDFLPQFVGEASVADFRIPGLNVSDGKIVENPYQAYPITNSSWLDETQLVSLRAQIEEKSQKRLHAQEIEKMRRPWKGRVIVLALIFCMLPFLYGYWRISNQQKTKQVKK